MSLVQYTFAIWMCLLLIIDEVAPCCEDEHGVLVYSVGTEIRKFFLKTRYVVTIMNNSRYRPVGVAVSKDCESIYWSNINKNEKAIMRQQFHGHATEVIADEGLFAPEKLVVDWVTGNVYFIDSYKKQIGVCTEDGINCTILLDSSVLDRPGGLVLNPKYGEMFWSDYGKRPAIWRAGMDGKGARIVVTVNDGWPKGLAIDYLRNHLYWINSKVEGIERMNLSENQSAERYRHLEGKKLRSLAIFGNKLYWNDWSTNSIESHDMSVVRDNTFIVNASALIYDMDIYHPSLKPPLPNSCMRHRCQELCLLAPNRRYTCACKVGKVLNPDLHSCSFEIAPLHLVITAGDKILHYHGESLGHDRIREVLTPIRMSQISYDRESKILIGDDQFTNALYSFDLVNNETRLITGPVYSRHLGGIDVNRGSRLISWSVTSIHRIDQVSLDDGAKSKYTYRDVPLDILSIPKHRKSLVVFKSHDKKLRIDWLLLGEPQKARTIIARLIGPKISLAYDKHSETVYFANERTGNIESFVMLPDCFNLHTYCNIDRQLVCSGVERPVSLAISNRKLFWISRRSNILQWVDLDDEYREIKNKTLPIQNIVETMDIVAVNPSIPA